MKQLYLNLCIWITPSLTAVGVEKCHHVGYRDLNLRSFSVARLYTTRGVDRIEMFSMFDAVKYGYVRE